MDVKGFIESGDIELYVMGLSSDAVTAEVIQMATLYPEVQQEIEAATIALEQYAATFATAPSPAIKPFLMAAINYMARMEAGEQPASPPLLHQASTIEDYAIWLNRPDLQLTEPLEDAKALIIGHTPEAITAIVWLKQGALPEEHSNEYERFLIVEGNCTIMIGDEPHLLGPGDRLDIPLYTNHYVLVTSEIPCKVILQRVAA